MVIYFNTNLKKATFVFNKEDIKQCHKHYNYIEIKKLLENTALSIYGDICAYKGFIDSITYKKGCIKIKVEAME